MKTITATSARSDLFTLIKSTIKGHRTVRISSKKGNAVLLSEEDYENILETANLLSIPGFKKSIRQADKEIKKGETYSLDQVFK